MQDSGKAPSVLALSRELKEYFENEYTISVKNDKEKKALEAKKAAKEAEKKKQKVTNVSVDDHPFWH